MKHVYETTYVKFRNNFSCITIKGNHKPRIITIRFNDMFGISEFGMKMKVSYNPKKKSKTIIYKD